MQQRRTSVVRAESNQANDSSETRAKQKNLKNLEHKQRAFFGADREQGVIG